jgi:SAM-dependent methyltransferase
MSQHDTDHTGQVNRSAAQVYEDFFIPALFQEWADRVADAAQLQPGDHVLDVACGTGVLTRAVATRVEPTGSVIGLDLNDGMLDVARQKAPDIEWQQGKAESLPFEDARFDAVVSQFGLMFFQDRVAAIKEMLRVLRPGGHLTIAVWASLEVTPGYKAMVDLLQRLFGGDIADNLRSPYILGDLRKLQSVLDDAGVVGAAITTLNGKARFPSIDAWMFTDIKGWTLADKIDDAQYAHLLAEAKRDLAQFETTSGEVVFDSPAHIITVTKAKR